MIMHPDFSFHIALEAISKNPNLKFPGGACLEGQRHKSMPTYPYMYSNSLQPLHFYLAISSPDLVKPKHPDIKIVMSKMNVFIQ